MSEKMPLYLFAILFCLLPEPVEVELPYEGQIVRVFEVLGEYLVG